MSMSTHAIGIRPTLALSIPLEGIQYYGSQLYMEVQLILHPDMCKCTAVKLCNVHEKQRARMYGRPTSSPPSD